MSYYGDGMSYYYGGAFANHSSLMTGTGRVYTPLRFAPHLSTISESPLGYRRYPPLLPTRTKRIINTSDIDVSTPRHLHTDHSRPGNRLRRDRPTIRIRSQALKDNPTLREHNERHEKTVGELLREKFFIKDKKPENDEPVDQDDYVNLPLDPSEATQGRLTRRMTRRRSSADIQMDPGQLEREAVIAQVQAEVLDNLVAEEQAEIEVEVRRGTLLSKNQLRSASAAAAAAAAAVNKSGLEADKSEDFKNKIPKKIKKKKKTTDKPSPPSVPSTLDDPGKVFKVEASNSVGDFSTLLINAKDQKIEQFRESIQLPPPKSGKMDGSDDEVVILPIKKPYLLDKSRNSVHLTLKPQIAKSLGRRENEGRSVLMKTDSVIEGQSEPANIRAKDTLECDTEVEVVRMIDDVGIEKSSACVTSDGEFMNDKIKSSSIVRDSAVPMTESTRDIGKDVCVLDMSDNRGDSGVIVDVKDHLVGDCVDKGMKTSKKTCALKISNGKNKKVEEGLSKEEEKSLNNHVNESKCNSIDAEEMPQQLNCSVGGDRPLKEGETCNEMSWSGQDLEAVVSTLESTEIQMKGKVDSPERLCNATVGSNKVQGKAIDTWKSEERGDNTIPDSPQKTNLLSKYKYSSTESVVLPSMSQPHSQDHPRSKMLNTSRFQSADNGLGSMELPINPPEKKLKQKILHNTKGLSFDCDDAKPSESSHPKKMKRSEKDKIPPVKKLKKKITSTKSLPLTLPEESTKDTFTSTKARAPRDPFNSLKSFPLTKLEPNLLPPLNEDEKSEDVDFWSEIHKSNSMKIDSPKLLSSSPPLLDEPSNVELTDSGIIENPNQTQSELSDAIFDKSLPAENSLTSDRNCETSETTRIKVLLSPENDTQTHVSGVSSLILEMGSISTAIAIPQTNDEEKILSVQMSHGLARDDQVPSNPPTPVPEVPIGSLIVGMGSISAAVALSKSENDERTIPCTEHDIDLQDTSHAENLSSDPSTPVLEVPPCLTKESSPSGLVESIASENVELKIPDLIDATILDRLEAAEDDDSPMTPTNEPISIGLSKWNKTADLTVLDEKNVPSSCAETGNEVATPKVSKKKQSRRKKSGSEETIIRRVPEKIPEAPKAVQPLKAVKISPPKTKRPVDLNKMFYTTPSSLLTATPRDLSKVKRVKLKEKNPVRTPSASSDSTGSTRSSQGTASSRGNSTEVDDEAHKRISSTRSNDSGFDGSPRLSNCDMACHKKCEKLTGNLCGLNQKLVAEALQALKRAPSQSSDNQRNSDSSDHVHGSGRITPPATNLPRFKKYTVEDFHFLKVLGKGSFGKVLLAELRGTDCVYAVKCLKKDVVLEDDDVECTLIERKVLTLATRHPYLCHLFCTFQTDSHLFFVMEYLNGGDLMFHIQKSGRFPEFRARFYAGEIWSGLNFLHKKGIVYRDLKLDNVLLDFEGHIRIADFGMCKLQIFLDRTADTFCGTPDYMAPEIIKGLKYNQAVDWWSFGVLLYEMLTGQSPFSGCDEDELFWSICNERPFIPRYLSQEAMDMLVALLEKDSGKRPMGHDIQAHVFFHSLSWDRLERRLLEPPFKPALDHTLDTRYFDTAFTVEKPRLTPVPEQILTSMDQGVFRGFSYTNPNATD